MLAMNPQLQTVLQQAIQAFQDGNLIKAEEELQYFLNVKPTEFTALHLLAIVYANQDKHDTAVEWYKKALEIIPGDASALSNYASSLSAIGLIKEALNIFRKVLEINPSDPVFFYNIANTLCELGRYEESLFYYEQSIKLDPQYFEAHNNYGKALYDLKRFSESLTFYDHAILINPFFIDCLINKGVCLNELKRFDEAITHYDKALSLKPDYAEGWANKGVTLNELKRFDEAITHYDKALSLKPDYAEGWANKGVTLNELKRFDEAITHYDKALSLKPDYAEGWSNKGVTLNELKRFDEAITHYDKALSLKPDIAWASGDLLHIKMKICDWSGLSESLEHIAKKVVANEQIINPFPLLALNDDALLHKKSSEIYIQSRYPFNPVLGPILKRPESQKIRVGYFSTDFGNHPVSFLTAELYELHDRSKFEIIAFSFGAGDKSPMRLRLSHAFNQFIDVSDMSDLGIAELSRNLQIDIAVDLGGHTRGGRTGIFSYRAAPIQTSYIGYLGTMGAEYYDYLLADKTTITDELQKFCSEKIVYLPSYQVNDRKRTISEKKFTKKELGLPETGFVFCCFNNNYKILPSTFDSWMRILNAVEGSVLFLFSGNELAKNNLINEASLRGVDSTRLVFGGPIAPEEYLARYRVCNLFLDTFPYNAGTTASDALWVGLPVLTLMGQSFASRMAASLLNAIGLPELITDTQKEYEALAIELALNTKKLADAKLKLANNRLNAPLFDTPLFTKNLEAAYLKMFERYQADSGVENISTQEGPTKTFKDISLG
jgi:protein O-GlcNAc transferase